MKDRKALQAALGIGLVALLYRLTLVFHYYGSEEEDYGNLGLILGTLQSTFTYIETEHMPMFTSLAAAATALTQDAHSGGETVAAFSGAAAVVLTVLIGWRWLSPAAGIIAGLLVAFQPDAALTAATPLRISTYVALTLGGIYAVGEKRMVLGGLVLGAAFLTRFDAAFTLLPALVVIAVLRKDKTLAVPIGILGATVIGWAIYYRMTLGTFAFWGAVADRSTGGQGGGITTVVQMLLLMVIPHLGLAIVAAAPFGVLKAIREPGRKHQRTEWLALCFAATFGFFCVAVFLSAYRWDHNLFWKWMCASGPFVALFGAHFWVQLVGDRSNRALLAVAAAAGLLTVGQFATETRAQLERSDTMYGTQVRLMDWVEQAFPDDVTLVADLIPATYLERKPTQRRVLRWSTDNVPDGLAQEAFGRWLLTERAALVITFQEDWVRSATKAPWLEGLTPVAAGPVRLEPTAMEPTYGWVAWRVHGPSSIPRPSREPPLDAGLVRVQYEQ
ncbi:MAG: hypothetical protein GY898_32945 [Proteobacteria bacterium]|nr:hypothetical protein [Pseudomonadota bacterium]